MGRPAPGEKEQQMRTIYLNALLDDRKRKRRHRLHWSLGSERAGTTALEGKPSATVVTSAS